MEPQSWMALFAAVFVLHVIPGQNVALITASASSSGLRGGLATLSGILLADVGWLLASFFAIAGILHVGALDPHTLRGVGGAFMAALGAYMIWQATRPAKAATAGPRRQQKRAVLVGFASGLANPMTFVFFAGLLPQLLSGTAFSMQSFATAELAIATAALVVFAPYLLCASFVPQRYTNYLTIAAATALAALGTASMIQAFV